jgi:hypothetical protein
VITQRYIVLFFIELSTRRVKIGGIVCGPNGLWMSQIGRDLTDTVGGILKMSRWETEKRPTSGLACALTTGSAGDKVLRAARQVVNRGATDLRLAAWSRFEATPRWAPTSAGLRSRLGAPKAITAMAPKLARLIYPC